MGHGFGQLAKIRGVIYFRLSPYEQRAFAGAIKNGVPNMFRRFRESILRIAPPFVGTYILYSWANERSDKLSRKNPKDYENDV